MRRSWLCVLAVAMLAGCGGSNSEESDVGGKAPSSSGPRLTSDEFVGRVDAVCKAVNPQLAEIMTAIVRTRDAARAGQVGLPETFDAFAMLLRRARATTERLEVRLRAIAPPRTEQDFHEALIASVRKGSSNLRQQLSAAEAQDSVRLRELSVNGSVIRAEGKGLLTGHGGFRFCGKG